MWPSKRAPQAETTPALEEIGLAPCAVAESCEALTIDYAEAFDEVTAEHVDQLVSAAGSWLSMGQALPEIIQEMRKEREEAVSFSLGLRERADRRTSSSSVEQELSRDIAVAHNTVRARFRPAGMGDFSRLLASARDYEEVTDIMLHLNELLALRPENASKLDTAFHIMFVSEDLVRATMAHIDFTEPRALQEIFDPSRFSELPSGLQRIAAMDIMGKETSIILRNAKRELDVDASPAVQLSKYIKDNHLPENVRHILRGVTIGATAMGAPVCPANNLGICVRVLEKMQLEELPEPLRRDIKLHSDKEVQSRLSRLTQLARQVNVPRILNASIAFDVRDNDTANNRSKKRRSNGTQLEKRDIAAVTTLENEIPSFNQVIVRIKNDEIEPVEFGFTNGWNDQEGLEVLLETKFMREYIDDHRSVDLRDAITSALRHILFSASYGQSMGAIVPILGSDQRHSSTDNISERKMRFSGQRAVGIGGGKMGRQMRIVFSQATESGVRHITLHKIVHKSELEKNRHVITK